MKNENTLHSISAWFNTATPKPTPADDNNDVWVSYKPIQKSHPNNKDRPRRYCAGYYSQVLQRWFVANDDVPF